MRLSMIVAGEREGESAKTISRSHVQGKENTWIPPWAFSFYPAGFGDGLAVISRYPVKILKSFRFNRYGALAVEAVVEMHSGLCRYGKRRESLSGTGGFGVVKLIEREVLSQGL